MTLGGNGKASQLNYMNVPIAVKLYLPFNLSLLEDPESNGLPVVGEWQDETWWPIMEMLIEEGALAACTKTYSVETFWYHRLLSRICDFQAPHCRLYKSGYTTKSFFRRQSLSSATSKCYYFNRGIMIAPPPLPKVSSSRAYKSRMS